MIRSPAATLAVNRVLDMILGAQMQPTKGEAKKIQERCSRITAAVRMFREREWLERRGQMMKSLRVVSKSNFLQFNYWFICSIFVFKIIISN